MKCFVLGVVGSVACSAIGITPLAPLPVAHAPFVRTGDVRHPAEMRVSEFFHRDKRHIGVAFVSGDKAVVVSGANNDYDCNNRIGFGRVVISAGGEVLATLCLQNGWSFALEDDDEPEVDSACGTAVWRRKWKTPAGEERVCSYNVSGDSEGRVFIDYDFGISEDEARSLGGVPFFSSVKLPDNRCLDRAYGMGVTSHIAQDQALLAKHPPPYHQNAVPVEEKSDTFFYEPENESRHFTITLPDGLGAGAKWYEGLVGLGTGNERQVLHLRYFAFGDFRIPGAHVRTKGRFVIDLCKSSRRVNAGEPPTGGVDFWGANAMHVPVPPTRNLMPNGSFEQNWKGWCWGYGGARNIRAKPGMEHFALTDEGMDGGMALRIRSSQCGVIWLRSASVPTVAGKKYALSWYGRSTNAVGTVSILPCSAGRGGRYKWPRKVDAVRVGPEWKRYSQTFEGDSAGIFVRIDGFDAVVDRIMLEEGSEATDYVEDPVLARLITSNADNDLRPGQPIEARLELVGQAAVRTHLDVTVRNFYFETVFRGTFDVDVAGGGARSIVPIALDGEKLGTGIFVVRLDFEAAGKRWTDYRRFVICEPLDNTHATARFFCGMPWFCRVDRSVDVARKMKEYGFGSLGAQGLGNAGYYKDENTASLCRENGFRLILHPVLYELPLPKMNKWHQLDKKDLTEDLFMRLDALAYKSAKECAPDDTLWTFFNEEETMVRRIGFDNHFKLVETAYRGCKRAFDERGLKLKFAPTHGVSHYFHGRNYDTIDSYLETAKRHGFMYDAVTIHSYQNIDGSILGSKDAEVETQHLIDRMKFYGYPNDTPILLSECFNMLPWYVPSWGATDWADSCWSGSPSEDLGLREFVHAGAMARLYLLALKFYPKVTQVNTWPFKINVAFLDHDLQPFAWLKMVNTLGHLFPDPTYFGGARPYPDVRGHVFLQDDKAILAVWTSNNDVERGKRRGGVLTMQLPDGVRFIDLMGNERQGGRAVPLTPAPLFIVSRKEDAGALLEAVRTAQTDDPSQAIEAEVRPMVDGAIELRLANSTSVPQKVNCGGGHALELAASADTTLCIRPSASVRPMEMYSFTTNYPFLSKPWKMSYFYVPRCGAKPDWSKVPALPIANEVRRSPGKPVSMKADYKVAWNEERLFLRVEIEDDVVLRRDAYPETDLRHNYLIDQCLEVYFDAFADARKAAVPGFDMNDSRYDFSAGTVWRMLAVNWQLAQGTVSATDEEVSRKLEQKYTPTEKGCVYEIAFSPRYLAPIELKAGTRASLGLFIHDRDKLTDKDENGLSNATERGKPCNKNPHLWPEFVLLP